MIPSHVTAVYFSPTGNTEKIVIAAAGSIAENFSVNVSCVDITALSARKKNLSFGKNDIVVFGFPVYAGRLPNKLISDLRSIFKGGGAAAVAMVTFGNRSFDNALKELESELCALGFNVISGAAIVSEHAFSSLLAPSRPDENDISDIRIFASKVCAKLKRGDNSLPCIPGDAMAPYYVPLDEFGKPAMFLKAVPKTLKERCTDCKMCAKMCPMGSVSYEDTSKINGVCIKCHACVCGCANKAKYFDDPAFVSHVKMLELNYTRPAVSEFFV